MDNQRVERRFQVLEGEVIARRLAGLAENMQRKSKNCFYCWDMIE